MSKDRTNQNGITLIALVITIIVMLILVGVSVTVALKGGLFTTAKKAKEDTATERDKELNLSEGKVEINGKEYNSIDEYVSGVSSNNPEEPTEPENPTNPSEQGKVTITPKKGTYTIGDAVTIGEESFYVIADDSEKVTLLAKDTVDTSNLLENAEFRGFSSTNYWSNETSYPLDLNDYPIPEGVTSVITAAKVYGTKIGGMGRLMTKEEVTSLQSTNSDILYGTNGKSSYNGLKYWFSSAKSGDLVGAVEGSSTTVCIVTSNGYDCPYYGVRPVVEISKANIS